MNNTNAVAAVIVAAIIALLLWGYLAFVLPAQHAYEQKMLAAGYHQECVPVQDTCYTYVSYGTGRHRTTVSVPYPCSRTVCNWVK